MNFFQIVNPDVFKIIASFLNPDDLFAVRITCKSLLNYIDDKIVKRLAYTITGIRDDVITDLNKAAILVGEKNSEIFNENKDEEDEQDEEDEEFERQLTLEYKKTQSLHKIYVAGININANLYQINKLLQVLNTLELKIVHPQHKCKPQYCEICDCPCVYIPYFSDSNLSFCYHCIIKHNFVSSNDIELFFTKKTDKLFSYAISYNFLRIVSGSAGLSYSN